jgi:hypothetical protein
LGAKIVSTGDAIKAAVNAAQNLIARSPDRSIGSERSS